jgi:nucleotide-binding universal stress UspA family protein
MTRQKIVVGYDDSPASRKALAWALEAAQGRHADVLMVNAARTFPPILPGHGDFVALPRDIATEAGKAALQMGVQLATRLAPQVTVTTLLVEGSPATTLLGLLDGAEMVVVGSRGHGGFTELVIGSTSLKLATHARCPVVVVHAETPGLEAGPEARRVVLGLGGHEHASADALVFAFEEASSRHVGLAALHAWQESYFDLPGKGGPIPKHIALEEFQVQQRQWLSEQVADLREKYPDVEVRLDVVAHNPAAVLVAASLGAELLVVGSRARGGIHSFMTLGSVTHAVLHHAHCPVAVVG